MMIDRKVVCITGRLPIPRRLATELITKSGGVYAGHVSKYTDILVVGAFPRGMTSTAKYAVAIKWVARGYPIKLMSTDEFLTSVKL